MPTYRWRADFVLPGLQLAHELTLGTIRVVPSPRGDLGHSQSTGHLTFETDTYLGEPEATAHALSLLTPLAVAGAALGGSVTTPTVTSIRLDNQVDLEASGVRIPLNGGLLLSWNVLAPDILAPSLSAGYDRARALPPDIAERVFRAGRWVWKANADADAHDQFLALWIAFNVLYGKPRGHEQKAIEDYLAEAISTELEANTVLDGVDTHTLRQLAESSLTLRRDGTDFRVANELKRVLDGPEANRSPREVLTLTCLVIYSIRCDIVHAGGASVPPGELQLIWASRDVLKTLLMHLLRGRLGLN